MEKSIFHALMRQHRDIEERFDRVEKEPSSFNDLRASLLAHAKAEELVVYPRFHQIVDLARDVRISYNDHDQMEHRLRELAAIDPADARFLYLLQELKQAFVDHVAVEEAEIFRIAKLELEPEESEELADQFLEVYQRLEFPSRNASPSISSPSSPV